MHSDSSKILIVGGGTWGLSTCYHLAIRGCKHITCLDKWPFPSLDSAGNDLNKMVRSEFAGDLVIQQLSQAAMHAWRTDPLFKSHFHETGRLSLANSPANVPEILQLYQELSTSTHRDQVQWLDNAEEIKLLAPHLTGAMTGWKGVFNPEGGWVHARNAMKAVGDECVKMGVTFVSGTAVKLIHHASEPKVIGVECANGTKWFADKIVLACGAWVDPLIDIQGQLVAKTWTLAHVQVREEGERRKLKGTPVVFDVEKGFFFEPDHDTGMVKVCNEVRESCSSCLPSFSRTTFLSIQDSRTTDIF
jgi:sarcosine oxidase/L-pipecolate oxidase